MKEYFLKRLDYNEWANRSLINFVNESNLKYGEIVKLISHILNSEYVWYVRVTQTKELERELWSVFKIEELELQVQEISRIWKTFLEGLSESSFSQIVSYSNSKGEPFKNSLEDIFAHLINHSTYHRGQVAKLIRQNNVVPPNTDYINYIRYIKK